VAQVANLPVGIGLEAVTLDTAKGFADFINADYAAMRDAAKFAGIQPT